MTQAPNDVAIENIGPKIEKEQQCKRKRQRKPSEDLNQLRND